MATGDVKRKLSAIFSADVKGYSLLMADDEEATVTTINAYRELMTDLVERHDGRVVDAKGDNILAEFSSIVDAVRCAVQIQKELALRNAGLPEHRRMEFRIGINLGDVIEEQGGIYGEGVNIAARLEGLAEPGTVYISGTVYDQVEGKLDLGFDYLGEQQVKNIVKPIRVYKVLTESASTELDADQKTFPEEKGFSLPDKPSIAVLPFTNMSGDSGQDYIADGITETIIACLSKISEMFVISRNSTFIYKGKSVKIQEVGRNLGVRYILEGSVQKVGERVRITAQLIDATTGHHLWAERYDRSMEDFFNLQDEITQEIAIALQVELTEGERARAYRTTKNLEAWACVVQGAGCFRLFTREDNAKARKLAIKATKMDPENVLAWILLGWTHAMDAGFGTGESATEHLKRAVTLAEKAVAMDDLNAEARSLLGYVRLFQKEYDKALMEGTKAVDLDPNNAYSHSTLAHTMLFSGNFNGAIKMFHKAMRLSPYYPDWNLLNLGNAYYMNEQYQEAVEAWKRYHMLLKRRGLSERRFLVGHIGLTACYMRLGQEDLAKKHLKEVFKLNPHFTLENLHKLNPYRDPKHFERITSVLLKAGLT
jgi:adenylate cyclase